MPMTGMPCFADAADIMRASSASPLQSSMAGTAFASEPATPTGMLVWPWKSQNLQCADREIAYVIEQA